MFSYAIIKRLLLDPVSLSTGNLDVTFDLTNSTYCPYRKPNDHPQYINTKSNHPPNIIKQIPASISRRISDNSSNEDAFNKAKPVHSKQIILKNLN